MLQSIAVKLWAHTLLSSSAWMWRVLQNRHHLLLSNPIAKIRTCSPLQICSCAPGSGFSWARSSYPVECLYLILSHRFFFWISFLLPWIKLTFSMSKKSQWSQQQQLQHRQFSIHPYRWSRRLHTRFLLPSAPWFSLRWFICLEEKSWRR